MLLLLAKELDVHVEFTGMEFSAILSYVESGKALVGAGSIIVTDERKQAVDFVEYYPAAFVLKFVFILYAFVKPARYGMI
jgi:polar amino acid transport system substrate-binding protein